MALTLSDDLGGMRDLMGRLGRVFGGLAARHRTHRDLVERRQALAALAKLSPEQLEDIGLDLEDILWGLDLPLRLNASVAVAARARVRRASEDARRQRRRAEMAAAYRARRQNERG